METTVTIDNDLLNKVMSGVKEHTQRQIVEDALRFFALQNKQGQARKYRGKLQWEGRHNDRDFDPMEKYLDLRVYNTDSFLVK